MGGPLLLQRKSSMADGRHFENWYDIGLSDSGEIWWAQVERHGTDDNEARLQTGNRILIWRPFVFRKRNS